MIPKKLLGAVVLAVALVPFGASPAFANHKLGKLHWAAETASTTVVPTLNDGAVAASWNPSGVRSDWAASDQIDFSSSSSSNADIIATSGNVGATGYLGVATIYYAPRSGHITHVDIELNEFYSLTNDQKQSVYCQELGHGLGLAHLHSRKYSPSTSCMSDAFALHPNFHDYAQLQLIYDHADGFNSFSATSRTNGRGQAKIVIPAR